MFKKIKFYLIGFIPGIIIVLFFLNQKGASCSYFPNDRVIAESMTKPFAYTPIVKTGLSQANVSEQFVKDSLVANGEINFDKSNAQKQPFPEYLLVYPKKDPKFEVTFEKQKDSVLITSFKSLK